jgi:hypothetical protein
MQPVHQHAATMALTLYHNSYTKAYEIISKNIDENHQLKHRQLKHQVSI